MAVPACIPDYTVPLPLLTSDRSPANRGAITSTCWDNAAAESFFASLKSDTYHRHDCDQRNEDVRHPSPRGDIQLLQVHPNASTRCPVDQDRHPREQHHLPRDTPPKRGGPDLIGRGGAADQHRVHLRQLGQLHHVG